MKPTTASESHVAPTLSLHSVPLKPLMLLIALASSKRYGHRIVLEPR